MHGRAVYLASPVIGQPAAAAAKQLVSVIAGNLEAVEYIKPILDFIGRETIVVGDDVAQGESSMAFVSSRVSFEDEAVCEYDAIWEHAGILGGIRPGRSNWLPTEQAT